MTDAVPMRRGPVVARPAFLSSDAKLVREAADGSQRAATAIYERYSQDLYRYCRAILGNPHDAQDALQNCFAKAFWALEGETREIKLKPWLYRIAYHESIDLLRVRRNTEEIDPEEAGNRPTPHQTLEERQRLEQLVRDMAALPERQRGALVMRELADMSFEEIGGAFDTSPEVVRQTVYEARVGLRAMEAGREMSCERVKKSLSDDDGRILRRRDVRAHLRTCSDCCAFERSIATRRRELAGLAPLSPAVSAGILHSLFGGGHGGAGGGGLVGILGGGAGKTVATSSILKSAAAVVAVTAVGGYTANVSGLVKLPLAGARSEGGSKTESGRPQSQTAVEASPVSLSRSAPQGVAGPGEPGSGHPGAPGEGPGGPGTPHGANPPGGPATASDPLGPAGNQGNGPPSGLPASSAHGQETAAAHAHSQSHPAHPPHPTKPPKPAHPPHRDHTAASPASPAKPPKPASASSSDLSHDAAPPHPESPGAPAGGPKTPAGRASHGD